MDRRLLWLAVGAFATSTMAFVFAGLLPLVAADNHVTISEAGRLVMAYSLAYAIGTPILATLTGAVDRKRVILGALVLFVAGNIMAATSNSFTVLTAAQIVMGMAAGLFAATAQAGLFGLFGHGRHHGCGHHNDCCAPAPSCCQPVPTCCAPAPSCCAPAADCCGSAPVESAPPTAAPPAAAPPASAAPPTPAPSAAPPAPAPAPAAPSAAAPAPAPAAPSAAAAYTGLRQAGEN